MASFLRNVNQQAYTAKKFVNTVVDPEVELPLDADITEPIFGQQYAAGLYISNDGDLEVIMGGSDVPIIFEKVKGGTTLNIQVKSVLSSSDCGPVIGFF